MVRDPTMLDLARCRRTKEGIAGEVVYVDSFGNLVTSILASDLDGLAGRLPRDVSLGSRRSIPFGNTYADVGAGRPVAYVGSTGYLEIGVRGGSAILELGVDVGSSVLVKPSRKARP